MSINDIIRICLEDLAACFGVEEDLYKTYFENEITKNDVLVKMMGERITMGDWQTVTPLGGPGTTLNGVVLYCLVRHYDLAYALETGVSGGFYSGFLLEGLRANHVSNPQLISVELSASPDVGNLLPEELKSAPEWLLVQGADSVEFMKNNWLTAQTSELFCHDSLHTMNHMMKEFLRFKTSDRHRFFVFIDDQNSEEFWRRCVQMGAFKKPGYDVKYISGNETRLKEHLGGFIKYEKNPAK